MHGRGRQESGLGTAALRQHLRELPLRVVLARGSATLGGPMTRRAVLIGLCWLACPSFADAQPPNARTAKAIADLGGTDDARVHAAIDALADARDARAIDALAEFLRAGQPDAFTDHALEALGESGRTEALDVLAELATHRRDAARRSAYASIGRIEALRVTALLVAGLGDPDPRVRGICATALGRRPSSEALDALFRALARGVPEAAAAIGQAGDAASIARFHAHLERQPLAAMLSGYEAFLRRDDIAERDKLEIVGRLGEVASARVKTFLQALVATTDWRRAPRVRQAVLDTAARIDARVPAAPGATQ